MTANRTKIENCKGQIMDGYKPSCIMNANPCVEYGIEMLGDFMDCMVDCEMSYVIKTLDYTNATRHGSSSVDYLLT